MVIFMRQTEAKMELAKNRREITAATKEQVDVWLSNGYPYGVDHGAAEVWNIATSEATRYGIDPSVASDVVQVYEEGLEIFGKPCAPEKFVSAYLRRLATLPRIAAIKDKLGIDTQDIGREQKLRRLIETYAWGAASRYGWNPQDAASKAGRYITEVLLTHSRNFQNTLRQTPSSSP